MFIEHTSIWARFLGLGVCLSGIWLAVWGAVQLLFLAQGEPWWFFVVGFALLGLASASVHSLGEWLWSFEEGWFGLQRVLRVIHAALIGGGLACGLVSSVGKALGVW